jgi:hypothetical protein
MVKLKIWSPSWYWWISSQEKRGLGSSKHRESMNRDWCYRYFLTWLQYQTFEHLIPDAPELILNFLAEENDVTAKRNAFAALESISHDQALNYLSSTFDSIQNADELLELVYLEFIRKDAIQSSERKGKYLRLLFDLLEAKWVPFIFKFSKNG